MKNGDELTAAVQKLLADEQEHTAMAQRAKAWLDDEAARVTTNIQILLNDLKSRMFEQVHTQTI